MKKIISLLLASFMLVSFAGCDAAGKSQSTTVTEEPVDTRPQMPNLVGLSLEQISMRYPKLKLDVTYEYDDEAKKDTVISQEIKASDRYNEGDSIPVTVSGGSKLIEIDDYTNRNIDDVEQLLEKQGFVCDVVYAEDEKITKNCVIKTDPPAREKAEAGTVVTCYVSLGAPQVKALVPDMVGKSIEEATDMASASGIKLTITYEDAEDVEPGTVLKQGLDPDTEVEPDARIAVTIAGESASSGNKTEILVNIKEGLSGEFQLKYYIDGTLQEEKTEIKEMSLTRKISWEVSGSEIHTYTVLVTSMETGKSAPLYEMEIDFAEDPPKQDDHGTYNENVFEELLNESGADTETSGETDNESSDESEPEAPEESE